MVQTVALRLGGALACSVVLTSHALAQEPVKADALLTAERFEAVHRMIKPQPGELRFHEIPWHLSVWEARKQAAAEGKPLLIWSGSGGAPIGVC
jgi:hypothetical protein